MLIAAKLRDALDDMQDGIEYANAAIVIHGHPVTTQRVDQATCEMR